MVNWLSEKCIKYPTIIKFIMEAMESEIDSWNKKFSSGKIQEMYLPARLGLAPTICYSNDAPRLHFSEVHCKFKNC